MPVMAECPRIRLKYQFAPLLLLLLLLIVSVEGNTIDQIFAAPAFRKIPEILKILEAHNAYEIKNNLLWREIEERLLACGRAV